MPFYGSSGGSLRKSRGCENHRGDQHSQQRSPLLHDCLLMIAARRWLPDTEQPGSHWSGTLPATSPANIGLMLLGRGHPQIGGRQNREQNGLHEGNKNVQSNEKERD